jgi:hypothetical protein
MREPNPSHVPTRTEKDTHLHVRKFLGIFRKGQGIEFQLLKATQGFSVILLAILGLRSTLQHVGSIEVKPGIVPESVDDLFQK